MGERFAIGLLLFLLVVPAPVCGQDADGPASDAINDGAIEDGAIEKDADAGAGEPQAGDEADAKAPPATPDAAGPTVAPTVVPTPRRIAPLGEWIRLGGGGKSKAPEAAPTATPTPVPTRAANPVLKDIAERYRGEEVSVPPYDGDWEKRALLNARDKKRLNRANVHRRKLIRKQRAALPPTSLRDRRGRPEIRLCSLNLNNRGLFEQERKILRRSKKSRHRRRGRAVSEAIMETGCSIVALQAVIGTSYTAAKDGLDELVKEVAEKTQAPWRAFLAPSNHKLAFHAFLVLETPEIRVVKTFSYRDEPLRRLKRKGFDEERFYRGPFEIELAVREAGTNRTRTLVVVTMQLQDRLQPVRGEPQGARIQMAETLREIVVERTNRFQGKVLPIFVLLGDRTAPRYAPSTQVLEGTIHLNEFAVGGPCELVNPSVLALEAGLESEAEGTGEEEAEDGAKDVKGRRSEPPLKVARCRRPGEKPPRVLFGVLGENLPPAPRGEVREIDGERKFFLVGPPAREERKRRLTNRERRAEAYLLQRDLPYARLEPDSVGEYSAGSRDVAGGSEHSPMIWLDLNW